MKPFAETFIRKLHPYLGIWWSGCPGQYCPKW
ncbi:hypothetical protein PVAP13_9KG032238 [Panicum virgatum]|uniref:Uncharacterized protein n=1 Tax=Panicum virgatum TaxID=38727 RepID=A0A8T0NBA9_PANVG|nr:hypothetical protein PVAP13_9KG032238 [Panicum virgatum]